MGNRGKGAKPQEGKNKGGRPKKKGHKRTILRARRLTDRVFARLEEILGDQEADRRHVLRASEIITHLAVMEFEDDTAEEKDEGVTVTYLPQWRAPAE